MKKPAVRMRKVPPAALEAFVAASDKPGKGRGATPGPSEVLRSKRGIMRRLTLYLPPEVARAFHARCIAEGTTMSATLEAWVVGYIAKG